MSPFYSTGIDGVATRLPSPHVYRLVGVPYAAGALGQGALAAPAALRRAGLLHHARDAGLDCADVGDIALPETAVLGYHSIPPIRHWPLPRSVWEATHDYLRPIVEAGHIPLVLGGDCSIFVGVVQALADVAPGQNLHVLYLDGHIDAEAPRAEMCIGAAAMGLRIATESSPFWPGPILPATSITAIGCSRQFHQQIPHFSLADVRRLGVEQVTHLALQRCHDATALLIHFDVDVMANAELPGAYDASDDGLTRAEAHLLLQLLLADPRVRAVEVTEYCPDNDPSQHGAKTLVELLTDTLVPSARGDE